MGNFEKRKVAIPTGIMKKIAEGDNNAFGELYYLTYKPVYGFILSMTMNKQDAEDILQETYIKVKMGSHLFKEPGNVMAWIMKIAKNNFLMLSRKRNRHNNVSYEEHSNNIEMSFDNIQNAQDRLFLEQLFSNIGYEERQIILLHVTMDMKFREISDFLDIPIGTVLTKYYRAMNVLQNISQEKKKSGKEAK